MMIRVRKFVYLLLVSSSITGHAVAAFAAVNDIMSRTTWKERTAVIGLTGSFLITAFNELYHRDIKAKERALEAARYDSDEAFKKASENLKKSRTTYYVGKVLSLLFGAASLAAGFSATSDLHKDHDEQSLRADEERLRAGPIGDAAKNPNNDKDIYESRQNQLLGVAINYGGNEIHFTPAYVHLNRPTPSKSNLDQYGHKDHRTMPLLDPNIPNAQAWDNEYLKKMGSALAISGELMLATPLGSTFYPYREHLARRIRRFDFILANIAQLNIKLLRGGLPFGYQRRILDGQVREECKKVLGAELKAMQEELAALDKALKR